ncbi:dynamin family protein [Striga asiatica]|uniref:Dynamin family protein n=1 Tax=Striga asiatica TaxID=4170 RepID=A0A5A7RC25_STRAF|nr:dynamin family protein [Striga asiatica]
MATTGSATGGIIGNTSNFLNTPSKSPSSENSASRKRPRHHQSMDTPSKSAYELKRRYEAYNRLQAAAVAFGEKLPIPEIVALGGQSDGKSSLLEALLGFRFNVREVEMGTRRPLVLQMIHDSNALEPRCRFQEEYSEEYGTAMISSTAIADTIKARTEALLKKTKAAVSPKPIVIRVEYAHCPNLTIIDTPGFVLKAKKGEPESTPDEILSMVKNIASPPHRILLFLQQSSVEWCSSLWLDTIREIDPAFRRTIIVVSKFDNRLKEFSDRWEVDRYLSASGYLGENTRPFFVALPKDRSIVSNDEFRRQIAQDSLLDGAADPAPEQWGKTTEEEKLESGIGGWPGVNMDTKPPNATLRLYGGAAFERVVHEFRCATYSVECPVVSREKVANILLAHAGRGGSRGVMEAAAEIARAAARSWLTPLLDTACERLAFVLCNLFDIAVERNRSSQPSRGQQSGDMEGYVGFHAALRHSYHKFVKNLARDCKQVVRHHLDSVTSPYSLVCYEADTTTPLTLTNRAHQIIQPWSFSLDLSGVGPTNETTVEQDNIPPERNEIVTPGKAAAEHREALRECQMTVPETPSPDQPCEASCVVKKELGGGHCVVELGLRKRQSRIGPNKRAQNGGGLLLGGGSGSPPYEEICSSAARHFARIREVLVERGVASTLNSGFLTPCRERLMVELGLDLFAVTDEKFMEMFVAPGTIDLLENERQSLQKRQKILNSCLSEFKNVARAL